MKLREFRLDDYEEVVDMFYDFIKEVFETNRKISPKYFFYKQVTSWINQRRHIVLAVNNEDKIVGFSCCYIDEFDCLTESVYNCEYAYVKPAYRNTRAAYMLFKNGSSKANDLGLNLVTNGRIENGVDNMMEKHFNLQRRFTNFERKQ